MKRKAYFIQLPNGKLVGADVDPGVAIPFETLDAARAAARAHFGIIGTWDWLNGRFVPRKRA